jgi:hypothetical protein
VGDTSAVDSALIGVLANDATLATLLPDGVWGDIAPLGATKFVIVSQSAHHDEPQFTGDAYEDILYLVKAVIRDTSGVTVAAAAARIQALLEDPTPFPITGYTLMKCHRTERVRLLEVDEDPSFRWQHRGGLYELFVSPQ